jgi:hypothetical protein
LVFVTLEAGEASHQSGWASSKDIIGMQLILSFHFFLTEFHFHVLLDDVTSMMMAHPNSN